MRCSPTTELPIAPAKIVRMPKLSVALELGDGLSDANITSNGEIITEITTSNQARKGNFGVGPSRIRSGRKSCSTQSTRKFAVHPIFSHVSVTNFDEVLRIRNGKAQVTVGDLRDHKVVELALPFCVPPLSHEQR